MQIIKSYSQVMVMKKPSLLLQPLFRRVTLLCITIGIVSGCATNGKISAVNEGNHVSVTENSHDPFEKFNRSIYQFNTKADKYVLKPAAELYQKITPNPVERGIGNFFDNLSEPVTIVNSTLQGKFDKAGISSGRFVLNSTLGILGVFDVADKFNIPTVNEDFGQTLAVWGVSSGPYLMLPLLGPSNLRDTGGLIVDPFFEPQTYLVRRKKRLALYAADAIDTRAGLLGSEDILEVQLDPYVFLRESYRQKRQQAITDSETNTFDDFDDDIEDL